MGAFLATPRTQKQSECGGSVDAAANLTSAYGAAAMQGWRQTMEDAHVAVPSLRALVKGAAAAPAPAAAAAAPAGGGGGSAAAAAAAAAAQEKDVSPGAASTAASTAAGGAAAAAGGDTSSDDFCCRALDELKQMQIEDIGVYGVFDGHGSNAVSYWAANNLLTVSLLSYTVLTFYVPSSLNS